MEPQLITTYFLFNFLQNIPASWHLSLPVSPPAQSMSEVMTALVETWNESFIIIIIIIIIIVETAATLELQEASLRMSRLSSSCRVSARLPP